MPRQCQPEPRLGKWGRAREEHIPIHRYCRMSMALTRNPNGYPEGRTKRYTLQSRALLTRLHYSTTAFKLINDDADVGFLVERETWTTHDLTHDGRATERRRKLFSVCGPAQSSDRQKKTFCKGERVKRQIMMPVWVGRWSLGPSGKSKLAEHDLMLNLMFA